MWIVQPMEITGADGKGTGRWRMTATSDEGGGGPFGDVSHDHGSSEEAESCERCDEYTARMSGFPSRAAMAASKAERDRREYERLKQKFGE